MAIAAAAASEVDDKQYEVGLQCSFSNVISRNRFKTTANVKTLSMCWPKRRKR
jgi:hypothetical protein